MKSAVFDCSGEAFFVGAAGRCFNWDGGEKGNKMPDVVAAGTGTTPAAFYLGLCRLRGILSPPAPNDNAAGGPFLAAAAMTLHRFSSLGLKSRIDAAFGLFLRVSLHRFASLSLKSRIDATLRCGVVLHAKPFFFAATKIRIGHGPRSRYGVAGEPIFLCGNED